MEACDIVLAALGDIPPEHAEVVGMSRLGDWAVVVLNTNLDGFYGYECLCQRTRDGWTEIGGNNSDGFRQLDDVVAVETSWWETPTQRAPDGSQLRLEFSARWFVADGGLREGAQSPEWGAQQGDDAELGDGAGEQERGPGAEEGGGQAGEEGTDR